MPIIVHRFDDPSDDKFVWKVNHSKVVLLVEIWNKGEETIHLFGEVSPVLKKVNGEIHTTFAATRREQNLKIVLAIFPSSKFVENAIREWSEALRASAKVSYQN